MKLRIQIFGLLLLLSSACTKIIDVQVNESDPQIVIEANYNASDQVVSVILSETKSVFGSTEIQYLSGAVITIIDSSGQQNMLIDQGDGNYLLDNYVPTYSSTYELKILLNGNEYNATSYLPEVVILDSLSAIYTEASLFGDAGYVVYMNFTDPAGKPNYYRANRVVNNEPLLKIGEQFIFDDSFSEGNAQTVPFFSDRYEIGDTISVRFISYNEDSYYYYTQLYALAGDGGQSAAPANPIGNWNNQALGHFAAWGSDVVSFVIE